MHQAEVSGCVSKNPDYSTIEKVARALNGGNNIDLDLEPAIIAAVKFCPISSVDVERSFSSYKTILADNRRSFKLQNLKELFFVYCNQDLNILSN